MENSAPQVELEPTISRLHKGFIWIVCSGEISGWWCTEFLLQLMAVYLSSVTGLYWMNWSIDENRSFKMLYNTKVMVAYISTLGR